MSIIRSLLGVGGWISDDSAPSFLLCVTGGTQQSTNPMSDKTLLNLFCGIEGVGALKERNRYSGRAFP